MEREGGKCGGSEGVDNLVFFATSEDAKGVGHVGSSHDGGVACLEGTSDSEAGADVGVGTVEEGASLFLTPFFVLSFRVGRFEEVDLGNAEAVLLPGH